MTNEEALAILLTHKTYIGEMDTDKLIDALDMAIKALEKQIPKKVIYEADGYADGELVYDTAICPNCGASYELDYDCGNYCPSCGQRLDWRTSDGETHNS